MKKLAIVCLFLINANLSVCVAKFDAEKLKKTIERSKGFKLAKIGGSGTISGVYFLAALASYVMAYDDLQKSFIAKESGLLSKRFLGKIFDSVLDASVGTAFMYCSAKLAKYCLHEAKKFNSKNPEIKANSKSGALKLKFNSKRTKNYLASIPLMIYSHELMKNGYQYLTSQKPSTKQKFEFYLTPILLSAMLYTINELINEN